MTDPAEQKARDDSRHLVIVSILVSFIFSLLLGLGLGLVGSKAVTAGRDAKAAAAANALTIHNTCIASNKSRALAIELWEYVFTLNPAPTAEQTETADKLLAFVRANYAQVACP
jgi:hypothetical protein